MPKRLASIDLPLHAGLAPSLPRRRRRLVRQIIMTTILIVLVGIIAAYWVLTDPARVRGEAEKYLSEIIGGHVHVNKATLSIFEGLRLEGVRVDVDDKGRPDSTIFRARVFWVRPNLTALLRGRLEAVQILAVDPQVLLCETVDNHQWNYQRLTRRPRPVDKRDMLEGPPVLPEVLLRAGLIEYSRIRLGRFEVMGRMAIDGQLTPYSENRYAFALNSRAPGEPQGPALHGTLNMDRLAVSASLVNLEFSSAIRAMLPWEVQQWWAEHQLSGRIRMPVFEYLPGQQGQKDSFRIEVQFDDVQFCILPEEVLGRQYAVMKLWRPGIHVDLPDLGLMSRAAVMDQFLQPLPIMLKKVSGRFVFTPQRITFSGVRGQVENNWVNLDGAIEGYRPSAPASVRLTATNLVVPEHPRYINTLPYDVRKVYNDFRPMGRISLAFEMDRSEEGGKLEMTGNVQVHDATFCFDDFPYPIRVDGGQVNFGPDPYTPGYRRVTLTDLHGYGLPNTPNAHNAITVNGWVSPIERGSEVKITVAGSRIILDPPLRAALPREGRDAVAMFDVNGTPEGARVDPSRPITPVQIEGAFMARIHRALGPRQHVTVEVDLDVKRGNGAFYGFAYPLRDVSGLVLVRPKVTEVRNMLIRKGADAWLKVDGFVHYGKDRPVRPDLKIVARNVPIDDDLRLAMPSQQREWLSKAGVSGRIDVDGSIHLPETAKKSDPIEFDLAIGLKDGAIWPVLDSSAITGATAKLQLNRTRLRIEALTGQRGTGRFSGGGEISWPQDHPKFSVLAHGEDVPLDKVLYQMVGAAGRKTWDSLRPQGSVDLSIGYSGGMEEGEGDSARAASPSYRIGITARKLAMKPVSFPWSMQNVTGSADITPERITLKDIVARHGDATLKISGGGTSQPQTDWALHVSGQSIAADAELMAALPEGLKSLLETSKLQGRISFDCPELKYRVGGDGPSTRPAGSPPDTYLSFNPHVELANATLAAGIPIVGVNGSADLTVEMHNSAIENLWGSVNIPTIDFAGRPMKNLRSNIVKRPGTDIYQFTNIRGDLAGGKMAGQVDLTLPKNRPAVYALQVTLLDVGVRDVVGDPGIKGLLNGRIDLKGLWSDPSTRIGRGTIQVQGNELYRVPVVFGWLELLNMAMPVKKPFNEARIEYIITGQKLTLEKITLRTAAIVMEGSGALDFGTRQFHMDFLADRADKFRIPVIDDFIDVARNEMLQIHVTGTVDQPQVKATSMNSFSTTMQTISESRQQKRTTPPRRK